MWAFYDAQPRDVRDILKVHVGNMLSRAFTVKMMMGVITELATHRALHPFYVKAIVFFHFIFCSEDSRQCLSREGAVSAAMVAAVSRTPCAPKPKTTKTPSTNDADIAPRARQSDVSRRRRRVRVRIHHHHHHHHQFVAVDPRDTDE